MRLLGKLMAVTLVLMTGAMLVMAAAGLIYLTHSRSYVAVPAVESWAGSQPLGSAHVEVAPGVYQAWPVVATAVNALPLLIVFSSFLL
ncbi:MAG: hypothetical protein HYV26_15220, partial [Candidatus Hydrogenedentes bacterium]|nr:hypothetical protein [Candidatus Hydrogenedentota bacterium]